MKLSDLNPNEVTPVETAAPSGPLKLSDLHPSEVTPAEEPGMLEAGARGLAQGATLGFGDELYGAGNAGVQALKKGSLADLHSDYAKGRDEVRANNDAAKKAHPYAYGAGELAGSAVPLAASGASVPALAATGAVGAVGNSDSSDPATLAKQAAMGGAMTGAAGAAMGAAAQSPVGKYIGDRLSGAAENFATTPLFNKVADATNIVGKTKGLVGKLAGSGILPESIQPAADAVSGAAGRMAAYKSPLAPIQAVSDASRGMSFLQDGVAKALDLTEGQFSRISKTPYFQSLKNAVENGGPTAAATTHYILQQTDPKYQELLKDDQK